MTAGSRSTQRQRKTREPARLDRLAHAITDRRPPITPGRAITLQDTIMGHKRLNSEPLVDAELTTVVAHAAAPLR
jgi:hypothetical protein